MVQDKRRAATRGARAYAKMPVRTQVLVDNDSILPVADRTCREIAVNHAHIHDPG
jgi:hypothetical protein